MPPRRTGAAGRRVAVQLDGRREPVLAGAVEALGASVVAVPVYRWELPDDVEPVRRLVGNVVDGSVDAVTFTSSPAVWNFAAVAEAMGATATVRAAMSERTLAVSVGPVCSQAIAAAGYANVVEPRRPRLGAMVQAFGRHVDEHRHSVMVGASRVQLAAAAVVVDGGIVSLTTRERAVLAMLLRRPGAVVTKSELLRIVWEGAAEAHAVEVTVGRLRRRLGGVLEIEAVPRAATGSCPDEWSRVAYSASPDE